MVIDVLPAGSVAPLPGMASVAHHVSDPNSALPASSFGQFSVAEVPRPKLQPPPRYTGSDPAVKVHRWLSQMRKYLQLCRVAPENMVDYAEAYLQGTALIVWQTSSVGHYGNDALTIRHWTTFCLILTARFGDPHAAQNRRAQFFALRYTGDWTYQSIQGFCTSVQDHVAEIAQPDLQGHSCPLDDRTAIEQFLSKFPGDFGKELAARVLCHPFPPASLDEAIQIILGHVMMLPNRPNVVAQVPFQMVGKRSRQESGAHASSSGSHGGQRPRLSFQGQARPASGAYQQAPPRPAVPASADGVFRDLRVLAAGEGARRRKAGLCMWCAKSGHILRECTTVQPAGPLSSDPPRLSAQAKGKGKMPMPGLGQ